MKGLVNISRTVRKRESKMQWDLYSPTQLNTSLFKSDSRKAKSDTAEKRE